MKYIKEGKTKKHPKIEKEERMKHEKHDLSCRLGDPCVSQRERCPLSSGNDARVVVQANQTLSTRESEKEEKEKE